MSHPVKHRRDLGSRETKECWLRCIRPCFRVRGFSRFHGSGAAARRCWLFAVSVASMAAPYRPSDRDAPSWNGDPATYAAFETACRWYVLTLKDSEKPGAAARLTGPAKSVVRHLDPACYHRTDGLERLLTLLRGSPLQTLLVPDCFAKLERWNTLRRKDHETLPE